jgi:hypothetical protein
MFCDNCGTKNPDNSKFCSGCGKPLSQQSASHPSISVSDILMKFEGKNGQIELYHDKIIIKRQGFIAVLTQGFTKGDKTIYLNQITGIQLKLGGLLVGYIQFTLPGGIESKKGVFDAQKDENTVTFNPLLNQSATQLKGKIEGLMQKSRQSINQTVQVSSADEIKKFKQLLDEGIITKDEFDKKKKELLGL